MFLEAYKGCRIMFLQSSIFSVLKRQTCCTGTNHFTTLDDVSLTVETLENTTQTLRMYSMALIVSLPIGTPPQTLPMVLDTGSQLSWTQCQRKLPRMSPTTSFDPSLSSSFSNLPCNSPLCMPRNPDFTLPTSCVNNLCHYSYFYADGTLAEGNLITEKFILSPSLITPPLVLGCTTSSSEPQWSIAVIKNLLDSIEPDILDV
ncbi:aspartic proteinase PCS1-like [Olea europaea var. sylvestris]|uniref:aspartic proteinase PCS1-like n=1 Tax=Olea europaea var. sylvestris TaxID=158386 RepID=UPI000C1D268B|nr:aspartic proteinase PCS1-like [Olea europaea var. sylvestris]